MLKDPTAWFSLVHVRSFSQPVQAFLVASVPGDGSSGLFQGLLPSLLFLQDAGIFAAADTGEGRCQLERRGSDCGGVAEPTVATLLSQSCGVSRV